MALVVEATPKQVAQAFPAAGFDETRLLRNNDDGAAPVAAITRLRFRSPLVAAVALWRFHRLYRDARRHQSFVRGDVLLANLTTLVNISIWSEARGMLLWTGSSAHVSAVRWTYGRLAESWSAYFLLGHLSPSANLWNGRVDFGSFVATVPTAPEADRR